MLTLPFQNLLVFFWCDKKFLIFWLSFCRAPFKAGKPIPVPNELMEMLTFSSRLLSLLRNSETLDPTTKYPGQPSVPRYPKEVNMYCAWRTYLEVGQTCSVPFKFWKSNKKLLTNAKLHLTAFGILLLQLWTSIVQRLDDIRLYFLLHYLCKEEKNKNKEHLHILKKEGNFVLYQEQGNTGKALIFFELSNIYLVL